MFSEEATKIILGLVGALAVLAIIVFTASKGKKNLDARATKADSTASAVEGEIDGLLK